MITLADLRDEKRVITLKEILDVINEERVEAVYKEKLESDKDFKDLIASM